MNSKQRRRFVREYKQKIELDRVIVRLEEGRPRWCDVSDPNALLNYSYDGEPVVVTAARLNFDYATTLKRLEKYKC